VIRVIVVDDHPVVRHGVSSILRYEQDITVVGVAEDGPQAIEMILAERPDVVLQDLHLPTLSGVDVMKQVRAQQPQIRFLVLTTYDTDEYITPALAAGAQGYLLKDSDPQDLVRGVRSVMAGKPALEPTVAARLMGRFQTPETPDTLSVREREVLQWLVRGESNKEIAVRLGVSDNTIKTHVSNIIDKLGVRSRTEAVSLAVQRKLVELP
jgi:DNA-binding NarL/FixJ family response regulator